MKYEMSILNKVPFVCLALVLGVFALCLAPTPEAAATIIDMHLTDHPDGNQAPPVYGLRLDNGSTKHTFSFENPDGVSRMTSILDTNAPPAGTLGTMTITGQMRHIKNNSYSGEIWMLQATMDLISSPYGSDAALENAIFNPNSSFGPLKFDNVSASLSLLTGAMGGGYDGSTSWVGKSNSQGDTFILNFNHRTNLNVLTGFGWLKDAVGNQGGTHDFLFVATPKAIPEPATMTLFGAAAAMAGAKRLRSGRTKQV